jgi:hypothetical protein
MQRNFHHGLPGFAYDDRALEAHAMTDTPDLPPAPPAGSPPPMAPASLPGTPAGRPRIWQAVVLFAAFGVIAGGSCAAFLSGNIGRASTANDLWSLLFVASVPFAAGAFALLVFRLWRRRVAESWPSLVQAALMGLAGAGLAVGGCGGWAMTMDASALMPVAFTLGAVFVAGLALALGAGELFAITLVRLIFARPGAR